LTFILCGGGRKKYGADMIIHHGEQNPETNFPQRSSEENTSLMRPPAATQINGTVARDTDGII